MLTGTSTGQCLPGSWQPGQAQRGDINVTIHMGITGSFAHRTYKSVYKQAYCFKNPQVRVGMKASFQR